jgi:predicted nucleotidyltransferase
MALDFNTVQGILKDYPYIASAYVFGSQASGRPRPMSDVDIALLLKKDAPHGKELLHQEDYLSYRIGKSLGVRDVDVITLNKNRFMEKFYFRGRLKRCEGI